MMIMGRQKQTTKKTKIAKEKKKKRKEKKKHDVVHSDRFNHLKQRKNSTFKKFWTKKKCFYVAYESIWFSAQTTKFWNTFQAYFYCSKQRHYQSQMEYGLSFEVPLRRRKKKTLFTGPTDPFFPIWKIFFLICQNFVKSAIFRPKF